MRALVALALLAAACHRSPPLPGVAPPKEPVLSDPDKQVALRDLKADVAAVHAALAAGKNPGYACERAAVAARELAGEKDEGVLKLLADAETVYGHDAPMAWAETKLKDAEQNSGNTTVKVGDCSTVREMLNHVSVKYQNDYAVLELVKRYKGSCPRVREREHFGSRASGGGGGGGGGGGSSRSAPTVDRDAQRRDCLNRCDRAEWDCRTRCQYCSGCVSNMSQEQCQNICNTCRQGCEQNLGFCKSGCGD
jgi:hypothetical protein